MIYLGKKIYYEKSTGNIIIEISECAGNVVKKTIEQDIETFTALSERNRDTFDVLELEYGQYAQDFAECNGYRVNPDTKELKFSYPDPNEPEQPPVYRPPLSEEIKQMKIKMQMQDATMEELMFIIIPELNGGGL